MCALHTSTKYACCTCCAAAVAGCVYWMSLSQGPCTAYGRRAWGSMCWMTHARQSALRATSSGTISLHSQGRCGQYLQEQDVVDSRERIAGCLATTRPWGCLGLSSALACVVHALTCHIHAAPPAPTPHSHKSALLKACVSSSSTKPQVYLDTHALVSMLFPTPTPTGLHI
jgi:hypothetical protein